MQKCSLTFEIVICSYQVMPDAVIKTHIGHPTIHLLHHAWRADLFCLQNNIFLLGYLSQQRYTAAMKRAKLLNFRKRAQLSEN